MATSEGSGDRLRRRGRAGLEYLAWLAGLLVTYLLLISSVTLLETVVGAALAASLAAAGVVATRPFRATARIPRAAWRRLLWLPLDLVRDLCWLVPLLWQVRPRGRLEMGALDEVVLAGVTRGEAPSLRAYAVLLLSTSPGCFVTDVSVRSGRPDRLVVHRLSGRPGRAELVVRR